MNATPAYVYQVGDRLPPPNPSYPDRCPTIREIKSDRDADTIFLICDGGVYRFSWEEEVTFPRRADGSHVDWASRSTPPLAEDVMVGDLLPPATAQPAPTGDEAMDAVLQLAWERNKQVVVAVTAEARSSRWVLRTVDEVDHQIRSFVVEPREPLVFPRPPRPRRKADRSARPLPKEFGGPYRQRSTGKEFFFLVHPYGRGRWPASAAEFNPYDPPGKPPFVMRPPETYKRWGEFEFVGTEGDRHPNDPAPR